MYKVVSECNNNEVWASGFYSERDTDVPHKTKKEKGL